MYKYETNLQALDNCPCQGSEQDTLIAYRFVFQDMRDSFTPALALDPPRIDKPPFVDSDYMKCSGFGLSMFASEQDARVRFSKLLGKNKHIHQKLGDKIASGTILPNLGERSKVEMSGHFDFFEYSGCDLTQHFSVIADLL